VKWNPEQINEINLLRGAMPFGMRLQLQSGIIREAGDAASTLISLKFW
jgi:hypothetical protein